ncbi:type II toxin-antitoxin system HipA family toxin [Pseudovibrio sp. Tun.PSC04-5.I4]|uniref:type II toxin-antitoxin system HipA family toxin n=1 Tax=Pseudovibrio sp. Tun.PSC04-5.I4 TaxID=1798213 RepID=UPI00088AD6D9|nr:type II toxin-antitoxin system HipA family toxin [Pseudovibrio sp. Tun.PSC04-5.I4]SDQ37771.1 serine/threonine-protein kinase HipA [Pseudovibrio sp. Tun.PSC04-5.I4]SDR45384.1 serine/threonine-protein kinase HipA [Pseudovibrio sp. Tun.PSC04-5.I4]
MVEVWIDWKGLHRVGTLHRTAGRGRERVSFTYHEGWLAYENAFDLSPDMPLGPGQFVPQAGQDMLAPLGDSSPDTWGRTVMRRYEGRMAEAEERRPRTLQETDYLLGVNDETRLGALRYKVDDEFQAHEGIGVPALLSLGDLLQASQRVLRGEETAEDLKMLFVPGSSLGGARPKASILDQHGRLSVAKFPKETDNYCVERWEAITMVIARRAGITVADHTLEMADDKPVFLSHRFDRNEEGRIPFISAMAMLNGRDGESYSYLDLADVITSESVAPDMDREELYRRVAFSILVTNLDDHMRNHGFLRGKGGWHLSPAYDINPIPNQPRVLKSFVNDDNPDASIELHRSQHENYLLEAKDADHIISEVAKATKTWKEVAHALGAPEREIKEMVSAFEHEETDLVW